MKGIIEHTFAKNLLSFSQTIETQFSKNVHLARDKYMSALYDVNTLPAVTWENIVAELKRKGGDKAFTQGLSFYYAGSASKNQVYEAITNWTPDEESYAVATRPWYRGAQKDTGVTIISYYEYITQLLLVCMTSPVPTVDGTDVVLAMDVDAASLVADMREYNEAERRFFITDSKGHILFHKNKEFEPSPSKSVNISQVPAYQALRAGAERPGERPTFYITDYDGLPYHFVRRTHEDTGFLLYVGMSDREISTPLTTVGIISAVLLTMIFLLLLYLIRNSTQRAAHSLNDALREKELARKETRAKSDFLANMSHEIRTPMNAIHGMTELILRADISGEVRTYACNIKSASKALLAIINDILDFSKIEAGKLELVSTPYAVLSLVHDLENLILVHIGQKPLQFSVTVAPDVPCELLGDEVRIRQILLNLLFNAVKFTAHGSVRLKIWKERQSPACIVLHMAVSDTGIGISAEDQKQLFSSFYQVNTRRNRSMEGTGLGLAICKKLVDRMGGSICLHSRVGRGSVFYVSIPQKIGCHDPVSSAPPLLPPGAVPPSSVPGFTAPEARILVVDDNDINLLIVEGLLKPFECAVAQATSARQCFDMLHTTPAAFDIIFMDHMMPEMDGVEATALLRTRHGTHYAQVPIIALTANAIVGAREMYLAAGFTDFLSKPIDVAEFNAIIEKYIPQHLRMRPAR